MACAPKKISQLRPALLSGDQKTRRLGQQKQELQREPHRNQPAHHKQTPPAKGGENQSRQIRRQHPAERHADNRERDRHITLAARHVFRSQRGRVRHRPAEPQARQQSQQTKGIHSVHLRHRERRHAKHCHTADQRRLSAHPVTDQSSGAAAYHHPDHADGKQRSKRLALHPPFLPHGGNRQTKQLDVGPIKHDGQRRQADEQHEVGRPASVVEQRGDVHGFVFGGWVHGAGKFLGHGKPRRCPANVRAAARERHS